MYRLWEVPDHPPTAPVHLVVGAMLPMTRQGSLSSILRDVVVRCVEQYRVDPARRILYCNRFTLEKTNQALLARSETIRRGVPEENIVVSRNPLNVRFRNTIEEARFGLRLLRFSSVRNPRILILANHIHMRRVLAAYRKLLSHGRDVELFWISSRDHAVYGSDSAQFRFRHPLLFFSYELLAMMYSKLRGWA